MNDSKLNSDALAPSSLDVESLTIAPADVDGERRHGDVLGDRVKPQHGWMRRAGQLRRDALSTADSARHIMRERPLMLTAIATGAGLMAGLAGRIIRHRMERSRRAAKESESAEYYC